MSPRSFVAVALAGVVSVSVSHRAVRAGSVTMPTSQPATSAEKRAASALEHDVVALLAAVDPTSDLATLQKTLAPKLAAAVERQFPKLTAGEEPTAIESPDHRFVVVVIGDAPAGANGKYARATSDAELLLVVGGRAGARSTGGECFGGTGHAEATKGIGIGLGGAGGDGDAEGVGGGGGGTSGATGPVGAFSLGGPGGKGNGTGGHGKPGTGVDPVNLPAIVAAAKAWDAAK